MDDNHVFALDIGTHSITGVILKSEDSKHTLVDYCVKKHPVRAMIDGQIHHVEEVAKSIKEVKETLEQTYGPLQKVCVAAAGRSLKTVTATSTIEINQRPITSEESIKHMELNAVLEAQKNLANQESNMNLSDYYCVGYSVLHYKIDDEKIGSLLEQSGNIATVDIIATFLPKVVIDSLLSALAKAELTMDSLTLEPIAAIQVLIPESMRRLNVALVDVGAGTSDIAITNSGTVVAYGMVPIAGDEITEAICDAYLLDFPLAEGKKQQIVNEGQATVEDILGIESIITYEELVEKISHNVKKLASSIAEEIIKLNGGPPKAVLLIGGGSQTPELTSELAQRLDLPTNRVGIRTIEAIQSLNYDTTIPQGPDFITPIGIAIIAKKSPINYISIKVNQNIVRMFEINQLTIGDCLLQAGIEINKFYGKPGIAAMVSLNGNEITIPGGSGEAPVIYLNNEKSTIDTFVKSGDEIEVEKGKDGQQPVITIEELVGQIPEVKIMFNEIPFTLKAAYYINNLRKQKDYYVQDRDRIEVIVPTTVKDFFTFVSTEELPEENDFEIYINDKLVHLGVAKTQILVNNEPVTLDYKFKNNDILSLVPKREVTVNMVLEEIQKDYYHTVHVYFDEELITIQQPKLIVKREHEALQIEDTIFPNDHLSIEEIAIQDFIFQDVFRYVDLDLTNKNGKFTLMKNDFPTTFYAKISEGDRLSIVWH